MRVTHLQNMIADRRVNTAFQWFMEKHGDSGRCVAIAIKERRAEFTHSLVQSIIRNTHKISPSFRVVNDKGEVFEIWQDPDRLIHKLLEQSVRRAFVSSLSKKCIHVKGHGGMKHHLKRLNKALEKYPYVYRTDIKDFYASIPHKALMRMLREKIDDPVIIRLLYETISAPIWVEGELMSRNGKGIPLTCPLSPLLAAIFLSSIDQLFDQRSDVFYIRYMDDLITLTKSQNRLEEVVRMTRQEMNALKVDPHPKKTFVGKTIRGFSFLGYDFSVVVRPPKKPGGPVKREVTQTVRAETMRRCFIRSLLLYKNSDSRERIEGYWKKFLIWAEHSVSEKDQWMLLTSESRWDYFLTHILPFYSTA